MYRRFIALVAVAVVFSVAGRSFAAGETESAAADEQALKAAGLKIEAPALTEYLRKQVKPAKAGVDAVQLAALRQLGRMKPAGAADAILAFLPHAADDGVAEEARAVLTRIVVVEGKLDPALLRAIEDAQPTVRATAAELAVRKGSLADLPAVKALLKDKDAAVRLRTAVALAELRDADAVPVLIALLAEATNDQAAQAESSLHELAGGLAPAAPLGDDAAAHKKCREAWDAWWSGLDDKALLERFRKATLTEALREKLATLVKQLGDEDFDTREQASAGLVEAGSAAVPLLLQAAKSTDTEVIRRAEACLHQIDKEPGKSNPASHCRLLAVRKPAGAAGVLLAYRPFAHDDASAEEIQNALNAIAVRDARPDKALIDALADVKVPSRRAAAGAALAHTDAGRQLPDVRRCLQDADPAVRMPVALALARLRDREAVAALIDGLADASQEQLATAEELLIRLAGDPPGTPTGTDRPSRLKYREVWSTWWKAQGATLDLNRLDEAPRQLGYTLLVIPNNQKVCELDRNGKQRWEINGLQYPFDAQVLPNNRVLIAEFHGGKVTERTLDGKITWEKAITWPIACQRLPNGNTFIATRNQLLEVNREGKEVKTITRPRHEIFGAQRLRNGEFAIILNTQRFVRLDAAGKELKSFAIGPVHGYVQFDLLPNGNVIMPQQNNNKVVEFDSNGKQIWEAASQMPFAALRLSNGRTLTAGITSNQVIEIDRAGKTVWQAATTAPSLRVRRR